MTTAKVLGFNYSALDESARNEMQEDARVIKERANRTAIDAIEIGRRLQSARARIPHGVWLAWAKLEFGWTQSVISNYMRIAERFGELKNLDHFQPTALVRLVRRNIPEGAVQEAMERAAGGEFVTCKRAEDLIVKHLPQTAQQTYGAPLDRITGKVRSAAKRLDPKSLLTLADRLLDLAMDFREQARDREKKANRGRREAAAAVHKDETAAAALPALA